jgi:RHS repeat-associated protein
MRTATFPSRRNGTATIVRAFIVAFLFSLLSVAAVAQTQKVTDGSTPSGLSAGAPAGSYSLSGFESVNPYNGGLNFSLPLLTVSGRGGAGYTVTLRIDQKWIIRKELIPHQAANFIPTPRWLDESNSIEQTYSVGRVTARQAGSRNFVTIPNSGCSSVHQITLTRLTFTAPDGTEYELRDTAQNGTAHFTNATTCHAETANNRGKVFITADGTSATFISDFDIKDYPGSNPTNIAPTGYMILKDGTRFRIGEAGAVDWMRDRNGNLVMFGYTYINGYRKLVSIVDSLGRQVTISNGSPVTITYQGFGGLDRTIKINIAGLSTAVLRSDFQIHTEDYLFPGLHNPEEGSLNVTPQVVSSVELPDGRTYQFKYDDYAELARVMLPTGGAIEYDYAAGLTDSASNGMFNDANFEKQVYRRIVERRIYPDGGSGSAYSVKQVYSRPESSTSNAGYVDEQECKSGPSVGQCDTGAARLSSERHYYYGSPRASFSIQPYDYAGWQEGKEYRTEVYDPQTGALLRSAANTWQQPVNGATWPLTSGTTETNGAVRSNNPQVTQVLTTLSDTNQVSKQTCSFDQYSNRTDSWEYDFGAVGSGTPGSFLRRTHTDFVTASSYVNAVVNPLVGASLRGLPSQQWVATDEAGSPSNWASLTIFEYDNYGSDSRHAPLITRQSIPGLCDTINAQNQCVLTSPAALTMRGNVTGVISYSNAATQTGAVTASKQYDVAGNVVKSIDALSNETQVSYLDSFCNDNVRCNGTYTPNTFAYPSATTSPSPDVSTLYGYTAGTFGTTQPLTSATIYDFYTGHTYSTTDANNRTARFEYENQPNQLDRVKAVVRPDGSRTDINYNDVVGNLYVHTLTDLDATRRVESYQFFDGLARPVRSLLNEGGSPISFITADTQYDALGRAYRMSNPYRTNGSNDPVNPSGRWTQTSFDALGRALTVTTPDGSILSTSYSGNAVTATDQTGQVRRSVTDVLGRLTRVDEPDASGNLGATDSPAQPTYYAYDVLGNLRMVTQATQTRTFVYDSLSRLTSAISPEGGTVSYSYDWNGNLQTKTDARGVTVTYRYDHMNRNIITSYTGGGTTTPEVRYYYDGAASGKGQLYWSEAAGVSATVVDSYDEVGRPTHYHQVYWVNNTWGQPFNVARTYDKAGHVLTETYPSGHIVTYNYDAAGRLGDNGTPSAFTGNLGDGVQRTYAAGVTYSPFGVVQQEQFGTATPLYHKLHYNARGQLFDIRLSTNSLAANEWDWNRGALVNYYSSNYAWEGDPATTPAPDNNGNLRRQQHWVPTDDATSSYSYTQDTFVYDSVNRLASATEVHGIPSWQSGQDSIQTYQYDRFGNRTINQTQTTSAPSVQFDGGDLQNTNRLYAPGDTVLQMSQRRMQYDSAGNLIFDNYTGGGTRAYDAEGRMTSAQDQYNGTTAYTYDAGGRRVKRNIDGTETWQVYGMGGELLAEYRAGVAPFAATKEYGYRGGELLVTMASGDDQRVKRFITNLYYGALQRDPTAQELADKSNLLAIAGLQGQAQLLLKAKEIARGLFTQTAYETAPYRSDTQYVADLYYTYLQRAPDDSGLGWWAGQVPSSGRSNICNAFEASTEFATSISTLYGTATTDNQRTEQFVNSFYLGVYGRPANSTELQTYRDDLNAAAAQGQIQVQAHAETMGRTLFAAQVSDLSISAQQFVTNLYEAFLQRGPDAGGFSFWTTQAGMTVAARQNVLNAFATCGSARDLSGALYRETFWLVSDLLGTPRMIVDRSGSLAGVKRHDYLPFGEELYANVSGRTSTQGYSAVDNIRQKFTGYERDDETNLDYAQARYYANVQGRFTSPDQLLINAGRLLDPQLLNLYTYARNNPLKFTDPTGLDVTLGGTEQGDYIDTLNKRDKHAFTVASINNKVTIVDAKGNALGKDALAALGKSLSGGEKELFNAITDTKVHAVIDTGDGQPDENVLFGRNDQAAGRGPAGRNTLDMSEIKLLDAPENKGGLTAADAVAHETLEAYANASGKSPGDAHAYATRNFGALEPPDDQGSRLTGRRDFVSGKYYSGEADFGVIKSDMTRTTMRATVKFTSGVNPGVTQPPFLYNVIKVERIP